MCFQILQCLSAQGLTSSAGGSQVPGEGGSGSGASRGLVKDRSTSTSVLIIQFLIWLFSFPHYSRWKLSWPEWRSVLYYQVQNFQYAIWGASPETISMDSSWHWVAWIAKACSCWSPVTCLQVICETFRVCFLLVITLSRDVYAHCCSNRRILISIFHPADPNL